MTDLSRFSMLPQELLKNFSIPDFGVDIKKFLFDLETIAIRQAMDQSGGVKKRAADLLRLNRTTLLMKLKGRGMLK